MDDDAGQGRRRQRPYETIERVVSVVFQAFGLAATVAFGIYALFAYQLELQAYTDQTIATNLTYAAIVEQQYASRLAEEANRWSFWSYQLALAQLQIAILDLCTQHPVSKSRSTPDILYSDVLTQGTDVFCRLQRRRQLHTQPSRVDLDIRSIQKHIRNSASASWHSAACSIHSTRISASRGDTCLCNTPRRRIQSGRRVVFRGCRSDCRGLRSTSV